MRRTRKRSASTERLVDPLDVLDDDRRRPAAATLGHGRDEERFDVPAAGVPGGWSTPSSARMSRTGPSGRWRGERVAEAAHDAPAGRAGRRGTKQARLARSCLAGDGDHLPRPGAVPHRPAEPRELTLALQEPTVEA